MEKCKCSILMALTIFRNEDRVGTRHTKTNGNLHKAKKVAQETAARFSFERNQLERAHNLVSNTKTLAPTKLVITEENSPL